MRRTWLAVFIVAIMSLLASCSSAQKNASPSPQNNIPRAQSTANAINRTANKVNMNDANAVKRHLEQLAKGIPGVKNANCVIVGNTAIVGIDVPGKMERSRVGTIKYSVAEAFRKDPYGINAIVTSDVDLNERIREVGEDMRRGRPFTGIMNELSDIVGRIVPQLPRDVRPPAETTPKDRAPATHGTPKGNRSL